MKKELKRQIRREIKEDEFASGLARAWTWADAHREHLRLAGLAVVVALVAALGFGWFRTKRVAESQAALAEAVATFRTPVAAAPQEGQPPTPGPSFATADERHERALAQFDGVVSRWGSLPAGQQARYFAALCRLRLGQLDQAKQAFEELARASDQVLGDRARFGLAEAQARAGQVDQALDGFRKLAEDPNGFVPRDYVLMTLAATLEGAERATEAGQTYERVAREHPDSVFAGEARQRAAYLKSPST